MISTTKYPMSSTKIDNDIEQRLSNLESDRITKNLKIKAVFEQQLSKNV
jgi:hypothetical protein